MLSSSLVAVCQSTLAIVVVAMASVQVIYAAEVDSTCRADPEPARLSEGTIRVMSLNIAHGRNSAWNQLLVSKDRTYENLRYIAALIEDNAPDVLALQEADGRSRWSGNFDHVAYVAERTALPCVVHGLHSSSWISNYGTALLSRASPVESTSVQFSPSWPSKQKGFVTTTLNWPVNKELVPVTFISVHFDFLRASVRDRQVTELVTHLADTEGLVVLMGDLNSDWKQERSHVRLLANELGLHAFFPGQDGLGTYKATAGKRLDWVLISQEMAFETYEVLPDIVADHFAVFAEITYRGNLHQ